MSVTATDLTRLTAVQMADGMAAGYFTAVGPNAGSAMLRSENSSAVATPATLTRTLGPCTW